LAWFAKGRPIWLYLALFSVAIILPALIGSSYLLHRYAESERQTARAQFLGDAALLAGTINRELSNSLTTLRLLAASPDIDRRDFAAFHARASAALEGTGFFVLLLDPSFRQLLNTRVPYGTALGKSADPRSPEAAFREALPQVSDVFVGSVAKEPVFNVTLPVERNGEVLYALILTRNAKSLAESMSAQTLFSDSLITLVDGQNRILARSEAHDDFVTKPLAAAIADKVHGYLGVTVVEEDDGSDWLIAHQTLLLADWRVILARHLAENERNLLASLWLMAASGATLLALSILMAFVFGRYMAVPMRDLARQGRALGARRPVVPLRTHLLEANEVSAVLAGAAEERERYEHHIGLLMSELRHRAKNQFAVIHSLTRMTARHSGDIDDFQSRFLPRLRSLAESLELLDSNQWRGIDLAKLVKAQMDSFGEPGARIKIEGPSLEIGSQAAQSLGLALHELGTNAVKYGALSIRQGEVQIHWGEEQPDGQEDAVFWMRWQEHNGPPVEPPSRTGFGTTVIDQMVCHSTGGNVDLRFDAGGLIWNFACYLAELQKEPSAEAED
jgi:two-component sensor histidine kinase